MSSTIRFAQGLVAVTTLAGLALFGALRSLHERFYGAFGLRPEEVGLDFIAVVARGGSELATLLLVATALVLFGRALGAAIFDSFSPPPDRKQLRIPRLDRHVRSVFLVLLLVLAVGAVFQTVNRATDRLAEAYEQVTQGFRVEPSAYLAIRVEPVRVEWIGDASPPPGASSDLMLLGTGGGTVFAYDLVSESLVRFPQNAVAVFQRCDESYPGLCLAPKTPDVDCRDLPTGNVEVLPPDPHVLDADEDGTGCEEGPSTAAGPAIFAGLSLVVLAGAFRFARLWGIEPREDSAD